MTVLDLAISRLHSRLFQRLPPVPQTYPHQLEVERKFTPTKASIAHLRKNNGTPPFASHVYLGRTVIKEFYLNSACGSLFRNGIYIRVRNGLFEAKIRKGGDYINSTFLELQGRSEIMKLVADAHLQPGDLQPHGWMRTLREEWRVDGFNVAVDGTLFGDWKECRPTYPQRPHVVGEVELCQNAELGGHKNAGKEMDERIEGFMGRYRWAFPSSGGKVKGKLTAWDSWERADNSKTMPHASV
ncbi:hypothetical protein BDW02DRAFT_621350 [Decorospora gaudefroyi]|uniref:CYTH domain-containing protein n=1 Tax=Decorospora gaudefroyi TaxID=184978 RepID=A0A6A5KM37_9PLEO|nr:hypothetical protein BDW02DRAFT_621350 [Decorospora gaudefroyi]